MPEDTAKPSEEIFLYRLTAMPTGAFVCCRPRSQSGFVATASYEHLAGVQVDDATLRDNAKWNAWCEANRESLTPEWAKGKFE
jgi:hypothetical protein